MKTLRILLIAALLPLAIIAQEPEPEALTFPQTVGEGEQAVTVTGWDGYAYILPDGSVIWSGAGEPSLADLQDAMATPRTPDPDQPVPASVTRRQLKQWLIVAGLIDEVEAALDAIADPTAKAIALNWWTESQDFERAHPLVDQLAAAPTIDMTSAEVDQAFREASQL